MKAIWNLREPYMNLVKITLSWEFILATWGGQKCSQMSDPQSSALLSQQSQQLHLCEFLRTLHPNLTSLVTFSSRAFQMVPLCLTKAGSKAKYSKLTLSFFYLLGLKPGKYFQLLLPWHRYLVSHNGTVTSCC
jgi:hypothetical protein